MALILAKRILKAHPNGFVGAIVEGRRGIGKSSYCLKSMYEVYKAHLGCSTEDAWEAALSNTLFDVDDVIKKLGKAADDNEVVLAWTWDDCGVGGSNMLWMIEYHKVNVLKALMDTVRSVATGVLLNCPNREGILKMLRSYDDYLVDIHKLDGHYSRVARGYNIYKLPSGMRRVYKNFEDKYSCHLPNWVFDKYEVTRNSYTKKAVDILRDLQKQAADKKRREEARA